MARRDRGHAVRTVRGPSPKLRRAHCPWPATACCDLCRQRVLQGHAEQSVGCSDNFAKLLVYNALSQTPLSDLRPFGSLDGPGSHPTAAMKSLAHMLDRAANVTGAACLANLRNQSANGVRLATF